jgi:hypothetical protein
MDKGDGTVTTRDAAAAQPRFMRVALASVIGLAGLSLAGCGGGGWSLGSLFDTASTAAPAEQPKAALTAPIAKVTINSIVGPPDPLGKQLQQEFGTALEQQRVAVVSKKDERGDFLLRPYILAAKEKKGTKVSYVLDVSDASGKRVNRFTGEETVPANASADPWAAITPTVAQAIASKATGSFVAWLPKGGNGPAVAADKAQPVAQAPEPPQQPQKSDVATRAAPAKQKVALASTSAATTGSIGRDGNLTALVPAVKGAPGDGSTSLTAAIRRALEAKGVALTDQSTPATYRVEGVVTLRASQAGKQPIEIEWIVKDPQGSKLGTVSQKNDIPEGSLDGPWGQIADQAASAAVQGILKLLPPTTAIN